MSTSKFSDPFMMKSPVTPLEGNAFIKAKIDAEKAGKTSFSFNGRNYPVKMKSDSPVNNNHNEDPAAKMKSRSPVEMHESDEYRETYNKWLSYGDKGGDKRDKEYRKLEKMAAHVNPTGEKLPRPKKQKSILEKDKSILENK